jgi:hypothetical protein
LQLEPGTKRVDGFGAALRATGPRHYAGVPPRGLHSMVALDDLADISKVIPGLDPED